MQMRNLTALQMLDMIRREITQSQVNVTAIPMVQPTPEKAVVHQAGETMVSLVDGMTLVYIPTGRFEMGASSGNLDEVAGAYSFTGWLLGGQNRSYECHVCKSPE